MNNERVYYSHDAEMHAMRIMSVVSLLFLMLGLGFGAIIALLFAPTSGKITRENLSKSMERGLQNGLDALEPAVKKAEKDMADLRHNVEEHMK